MIILEIGIKLDEDKTRGGRNYRLELNCHGEYSFEKVWVADFVQTSPNFTKKSHSQPNQV